MITTIMIITIIVIITIIIVITIILIITIIITIIIIIIRTWYLCPNLGALSVSTLATLASLSRRFATSSKIGSIIWQGPHHLAVAEKEEGEMVIWWMLSKVKK